MEADAVPDDEARIDDEINELVSKLQQAGSRKRKLQRKLAAADRAEAVWESHKTSVQQLAELSPQDAWERLLKGAGQVGARRALPAPRRPASTAPAPARSCRATSRAATGCCSPSRRGGPAPRRWLSPRRRWVRRCPRGKRTRSRRSPCPTSSSSRRCFACNMSRVWIGRFCAPHRRRTPPPHTPTLHAALAAACTTHVYATRAAGRRASALGCIPAGLRLRDPSIADSAERRSTGQCDVRATPRRRAAPRARARR